MRGQVDPTRAPALLLVLFALVHVAAPQRVVPGVCTSVEVRNSVDQLQQLTGCRVVEGQISILLLEHTTELDFKNISFPELREVTGYIKIYRMKGVTNLGDLFPNLAVVRGMQLFRDFAVVIFDNENIQSLGLRSLQVIERGAVRIQNNDQLCYANTIDWTRIMPEGVENNIIRNNYDERLCGLCPNAQSRMEDRRLSSKQCPADSGGRLLCWDESHCQKVCPTKCEDRGCMSDGTCCHANCLGGCEDGSPSNCHVCRHFSMGYGSNRHCITKCPAGTYQLFRRCVTEQDCRLMKAPQDSSPYDVMTPVTKTYKILNDTCVYICPSGYMERQEGKNVTCQPCPSSGCVRECSGGKVDSVTTAERFRGCTHVKESLEISLRALSGNAVALLESSLGEIREIEGALIVSRSYPLVSLMFLKKLERIGGKTSDNRSLNIFSNPNLELLWDWKTHKPIQIAKGKLFIHFNQKLCYEMIKPLKEMAVESNFSETEVSEINNGDKGSCSKAQLKLTIQGIHTGTVFLMWDQYCPEDFRRLLGYSIYYTVAETNVSLYGQRDACFDTWNVVDVSVDELNAQQQKSQNQTTAKSEKLDELNPCQKFQPAFSVINGLTPYTRYAAYVKTYTTLQDRKGAQSPIKYFRTLPSKPSPPVGLKVEMLSPHSVHIKWDPPTMPNGTIKLYHLEIRANSYNKGRILSQNLNYCANPTALSNMIAVRSEDVSEKPEDKITGDVSNGSCSCDKDIWKVNRFSSRAEADRIETIDFENFLQNTVYTKNRGKSKPKVQKSRSKRSVETTTGNNQLVLLSTNENPLPGRNYSNATDGGYVASSYYQLNGAARSLTVENMRHYTWYTVSIWACRAQQSVKSEESDAETDKAYNESWCSDRTQHIFRTLELLNADAVSNVRAVRVDTSPSNMSLPEVNVTWDPPANPNGFVVAYTLHHKRVEDNRQSALLELQSCMTVREFEAGGRSVVLRNFAPGNYSIRVTPLTVSGVGNISAPVYVFIPEQTAESSNAWVWGVVGGSLIVILLLVAFIWYAKREFLPPGEANKLIASVNPEYVSTMYVPDEWEVPRENIKFLKELGQGSFGMVYEGIAKNIEKGKTETRCAIKTVNEHATDRERIEFLNEASVMKAFDTFHVVRLMGVVSRAQPTLVVMELMELGDLKTYLRSHRPDADAPHPDKHPSLPPTLQNILQMAIEIADGMAYLSAKKFVHRDLAARNCMVAGDLTVKVGDFGMTRDIYETDYYRKGSKGLLPVRWMSPESLKDGVFSSSSDIWSYGVVLWEMATLAMQPYQGLSNEQVVRYVGEGGVMERPEHCPDRLYELMRLCWAHRPVNRPSFLRLVADLAPTAAPHFRHRSFFHSPQGQEFYALQRTNSEDEQDMPEVNVGAVATGSGSNLFGVSGRLASWVRELSSLRSRADDAAAEPLQPIQTKPVPGNGALRHDPPHGC